MKEKIQLIILNTLLIILEIIGLIVNIKTMHTIPIEYYTIDSNIFALIVTIINLIYILNNKKRPKWLDILYHMAVLGLTITFTVVILILAPMYNFNYKWLLFKDSMLYQHTLCPLLLLFTYLFYTKSNLNKQEIIYTMLFTIVYTVVIIICNLLLIVKGPYPFLLVYKQPIYMSILWVILIDGGAYLLSLGLYKINKKIFNR